MLRDRSPPKWPRRLAVQSYLADSPVIALPVFVLQRLPQFDMGEPDPQLLCSCLRCAAEMYGAFINSNVFGLAALVGCPV